MNTMKRAAELLKGVQWQYRPYDEHWHIESGYYCPECGGKENDGHAENCELLTVIAELDRMAQSAQVNQQMLEALKELRDAYQEFMGVPAVKANAAIAAAEAAQEQENNQADPVSTPGLYAVLFRDNWDGESDVYHMLAELIDSGKWVDHRSGRELLEYEGDAILKVWPLNDDKATQVPTRDMLMRVAESVRAACFDACNENGGDWAAIHSLDIAEVINDSLAEIIGELGATDAAGQANKQPEPGTVPYCLRILRDVPLRQARLLGPAICEYAGNQGLSGWSQGREVQRMGEKKWNGNRLKPRHGMEAQCSLPLAAM